MIDTNTYTYLCFSIRFIYRYVHKCIHICIHIGGLVHVCNTAQPATALAATGQASAVSVGGGGGANPNHRQVHVAVACALHREREGVALLAGRVGARPLAGVGRVDGAGGDVADRDALVLGVGKPAVFCVIQRLAGPSSRADVDSRRAARAVLVRNVEACQIIAFEGPAATTRCCVRACIIARACVCATAPCVAPLWRD